MGSMPGLSIFSRWLELLIAATKLSSGTNALRRRLDLMLALSVQPLHYPREQMLWARD